MTPDGLQRGQEKERGKAVGEQKDPQAQPGALQDNGAAGPGRTRADA